MNAESKTSRGDGDEGRGKKEPERNQNNGERTLSNNYYSQKVTHAWDKKGCFMKELVGTGPQRGAVASGEVASTSP